MKINPKPLEKKTRPNNKFQDTVEYYLGNGNLPEESRKYARDLIKYQCRDSKKNDR